MAKVQNNPAAGAVSLKVLAERKIEGINKSTQFKVDQRIINVVPGFNGRPIDPDHVASIKVAKLAGAVFPPLFVNVDSRNGSINLVDGEHRLTADLELIAEGHDIGAVDCMQFKGSDMDRIEHMICSASGKPLTPLELGIQYRKLVNMGRSFKEIADKVGKSDQHVRDMITLAESDSDVQGMVKRKEVSAATALGVVKKHGSGAGKVLADGLEKAKAKGKTKVTAKTIKPKAVMEVMSLVDAIKAEIESDGLVMAETSCPEHADLIVYLRTSGAKER